MEIEVERRGAVTLVTINRPDAANALSIAVRDALEAALVAFDRDPDARVAVLTGAGEKAFCAGADLRAAPDAVFAATMVLEASDRPLVRDLHLSKPLIAAVNGHALGGGPRITAALCRIPPAASSRPGCRVDVRPGGDGADDEWCTSRTFPASASAARRRPSPTSARTRAA